MMGPDETRYYILTGSSPIAADFLTWVRWLHSVDRVVALTHVPVGDGVVVEVSTVFLGIDQGRYEGRPLLWETLVMGGPYRGRTVRYSSEAEAREGHHAMVGALLDPGVLTD